MYFYLIGIDYKKAPLDIREDVFRKREEVNNFLKQRMPGQTALLSTCNRVELYAFAQQTSEALENIKEFIMRFPVFLNYGYVKCAEREVLQHALRLACGLESQNVGEQEIALQLHSWIGQEGFPPFLRKIWIRILAESLRIRRASGLHDKHITIAQIIKEELLRNQQQYPIRNVVVIGTGKVAQLFAQCGSGEFELFFVSRKKHKRALALAAMAEASVIEYEALPSFLRVADALISATSSPHYILKKDMLAALMRERKRPLLIYDLALPRDVEPQARTIPGVTVNDLDSLVRLLEGRNAVLAPYVRKAGALIEDFINELFFKEGCYVYQGRNTAECIGAKTI